MRVVGRDLELEEVPGDWSEIRLVVAVAVTREALILDAGRPDDVAVVVVDRSAALLEREVRLASVLAEAQLARSFREPVGVLRQHIGAVLDHVRQGGLVGVLRRDDVRDRADRGQVLAVAVERLRDGPERDLAPFRTDHARSLAVALAGLTGRATVGDVE